MRVCVCVRRSAGQTRDHTYAVGSFERETLGRKNVVDVVPWTRLHKRKQKQTKTRSVRVCVCVTIKLSFCNSNTHTHTHSHRRAETSSHTHSPEFIILAVAWAWWWLSIFAGLVVVLLFVAAAVCVNGQQSTTILFLDCFCFWACRHSGKGNAGCCEAWLGMPSRHR